MGDKTYADDLRLELARRIRSARRSVDGLKQSDVTKKMAEYGVEMSPSAYAKLERGERGIAFVEAAVLTRVLRINLVDLVPVKVDPVEVIDKSVANLRANTSACFEELLELSSRVRLIASSLRELQDLTRKHKILPKVAQVSDEILALSDARTLLAISKTIDEMASVMNRLNGDVFSVEASIYNRDNPMDDFEPSDDDAPERLEG